LAGMAGGLNDVLYLNPHLSPFLPDLNSYYLLGLRLGLFVIEFL